jgi:sugar phosphate isomerase/epimerase
VSWKACLATSSGPTGFGPLLYAGRVRECARVSRELGFEGIEISMRGPDELDRRELEAVLREHRLELAALASGRIFLEEGLSLADPDEAARGRAVVRVLQLIEYGAAFGAPVIVGLARGRGAGGEEERGQELDRFAESMQQCADHAARQRVGLLLEAINRYETALLNTVADAHPIVERVGRSNLTILLDVFHMNIEEVSIDDAVRATGAHLGHVHVVDSNRRAPGLGHIDYVPIVEALREVGYHGWLSAEVLPLPGDRAAAEQARRFTATMNLAIESGVV